MLFCQDIDLLYWEPDVVKDAAFVSQTLDSGTGDINATAFSPSAGGRAFTTQQVRVGHLLVLGGSAPGTYVVTSVSAFELQVSILHDELFPESGSPAAAVGTVTASTVPFAIRTFYAQRKVVSDLLLQSLGVVPGTPEALTVSVINPLALKRACVLGTLQMIYSAVAAAASEPAKYTVRSQLYERLYRRALLAAQVDLDLDGDGRADVRRSPGLLRMVRN